MGKFKLEAGAEFDIMDKEEMSGVLDDFLAKIGQGVKFRRLVRYFDVSNNQVLDTTGIGPDPGFIWDVRYIHTDASTAATPGTSLVYLGGISPANLVGVQANNANTPGMTYNKQILAHAGENLIFQLNGSVIASPLQLAVALHVIEVPVFHEGQLLL